MISWWILLLILAGYLFYSCIFKTWGLPPGPMPLPIIGSTYAIFWSKTEQAHQRIRALSEKYGPLMTFWIGGKAFVFLTDFAMMRELVGGKMAEAFNGRPKGTIQDLLRGGYGIAQAEGAKWKEQRRFTMMTLRNFGFGKNVMEKKIVDEVKILTAYFEEERKKACGGPISLADGFTACIGSIVENVILGHRLEMEDPRFKKLQRMINENFTLMGDPALQMCSQYPWLRIFPKFAKPFNRVHRNKDDFVAFMKEEIAQHKRTFDPNAEPEDYTAAYLKEMHDRKRKGQDTGYFEEEQLAFILFDLWAAGLDTTVNTLKWGVLFLVNNPDVQETTYRELRSFYGSSDRAVSMGDRQDLPYTAAMVMEVQRRANIGPINIPHRTTQDVHIAGYKVPKDTVFIPQISAVHLDPALFPQPDLFQPERFLDDRGGLRRAEELVPFSLGKRVCVGESLARMELFIILASLVRSFRFRCGEGQDRLPEKAVFGFTLSPQPFNVVLEPRQ